MKLAIFCSIIFASLLNFSCRQNVENSSNSSNLSYENLEDITRPTPTPEKFKESDSNDSLSTQNSADEPSLLEFQDYKLEKVTVKR